MVGVIVTLLERMMSKSKHMTKGPQKRKKKVSMIQFLTMPIADSLNVKSNIIIYRSVISLVLIEN